MDRRDPRNISETWVFKAPSQSHMVITVLVDAILSALVVIGILTLLKVGALGVLAAKASWSGYVMTVAGSTVVLVDSVAAVILKIRLSGAKYDDSTRSWKVKRTSKLKEQIAPWMKRK